ncbi:MAG: hypothetical protein KGL43_26490 [Burkholderiales bacterium]|nr:hypothetical protein [Burkholderiales bacterium]MDE2398113.1 hypothetical protein [Burkholderiales bacterium]MDE2457155.1 hypothetical protein [Burkholderiales bacterium]
MAATIRDSYGRFHVVRVSAETWAIGTELHGPQPSLGAHFFSTAAGRRAVEVIFVLVNCDLATALLHQTLQATSNLRQFDPSTPGLLPRQPSRLPAVDALAAPGRRSRPARTRLAPNWRPWASKPRPVIKDRSTTPLEAKAVSGPTVDESPNTVDSSATDLIP